MIERGIAERLDKEVVKWVSSIKNEEVRKVAKQNAIVAGGAIASLIQGEEPKDIDIYFRSPDAAAMVLGYYINNYMENSNIGYYERKCGPEDLPGVTITFPTRDAMWVGPKVELSVGCSKEGSDDGLVTSSDTKNEYTPKCLTASALSLTNGVQLIHRFCGPPERITDTFDFVHCTGTFDCELYKLNISREVYHSIVNKRLIYIGSRYPVCSLFRIRKFIHRGWHIGAGDVLKMAIQVSQLDLLKYEVLVDQLIGVDYLYFLSLINSLSEESLTMHGLLSKIDEIMGCEVLNQERDS